MDAVDIPGKFNIPFASAAVAPYIRPIPQASQIGVQAGAASLTDGFPPVTFNTPGAGGTPPFGEDFNGILKQITQWARWQCAGGTVPYDATFQAAVGGYPKGVLVASAITFGLFFFSQADGNTSNPDAGGANWTQLSFFGSATTGDAKMTYKATADTGWILVNADPFTIGDVSSGATYAAANAAALYSLFWGNVSNTYAPVSGGRGATAAADFAAQKTLGIPRLLGRALCVGGAGSGLTARALGQFLGEELHTMTLAELVAHTHTYLQVNTPTVVNNGSNFATFASSATGNTGSTGSTTPFNVMQPSAFLNVMVKL